MLWPRTLLLALGILNAGPGAADAQEACASERQRIESLARAEQYREALEASVDLLQEHPDCDRGDEILYNAGLYAEASRDLGRAIRLREMLLTHFPQSSLAPQAMFLVAANYHALASYSPAAAAYERFARLYPAAERGECADGGLCPDAMEALQNAIFFRMGLGDMDEAQADAALFERNYARTRPRLAADVALALAHVFDLKEQWTEAAQRAEAFLRGYPAAPADQVLGAHVIAARAYRAMGRTAAIAPHIDAARALWRPEIVRALETEYADDDEPAFRLARMRDAVSQAIFIDTDARSRSILAMRVRVPPEELAGLASALAPIAELEISEWMIAAAERLGEAHAHAASLLTGAEAAEATRTAIDRYEYCLQYAVRTRWMDDRARRCAEALTRLDPDHHPAGPFELLGAPAIERGEAEPEVEPALSATAD